MTDRLRIYTDIAEARRTILRRQASAEPTLPESARERIRRVFGADLSAGEVVRRVIERVRKEGDAAVRDLTRSLDDAEIGLMEVHPAAIQEAYGEVPESLIEALQIAAERIRAFHVRSLPTSWLHYEGTGALGQIVRPLQRVGIYSPRGSAGYPSTILMQAVIAKVAGVEEIIVVAPPVKDGMPSASTLIAADIAGVDRVFRIGGPQAIAALAYGTESIPRVDKVLGPGGIFVALAKRQVSGDVAIDSVAGPTETVIVADESADATSVALDMLAQAEHDPLATALLITTSGALAEKAADEIERLVPTLSRGSTISDSLARNGGAVVVPDLTAAMALANEYAPEHMCLMLKDSWAAVGMVRNAGGVFVGEHSLEAVGDYTAGPSHVMPTSGTARFSSPVNVWDFLKLTSVFALSPQTVAEIGPAAVEIAEAEGFTAHAEAIRHRLGRG